MGNGTDGLNKNDRFQEKVRFYEGIHVLPKNISKANGAVIWISALSIGGLCGLAEIKAPWYAYALLAFFATKDGVLAVWREKNVKGTTSRSARKDSS
jgi:hypothetical protein